MKNPFPSLVAQLRDPRSLNWKALAALTAVVVAFAYLYRSSAEVIFSEENAAEGSAIVRAIEAFKVGTGRYPEKLEQLKPKYLAEIPKPAADTNFVYAVSSDGKECWFGYQTHRGVLNEYECATRKWAHREYEDSTALRSMRKEFVMGPKG